MGVFRCLPLFSRGTLPLLLVLGLNLSQAQTAGQPTISFTYENAKLQPHKYVITVSEDGNGHFQSETDAAPPASADQADNLPAGPLDQPIHISKALRDNLFATARKNKHFGFPCEDKDKNLAFQGIKTLAYDGPDGKGSCTYNWSKNAQINKLTDQFQAVAATLDEGAKLQRRYEHSRLSLDKEMEGLAAMAQEGRAIELENIAPILKTLATDEAVLQRVQRHARDLLQMAKND